jgi:HD-GYP domain-containing protein (c-di-GMP phosphodiesterase class II)
MSDTLQSNDKRLEHCLEIQRRLGGERNVDRLAQLVMREMTGLFDAERSSLFLFDWESMELRARFAEGVVGRALVVPLRMGIVGTAILRRELLNVTNVYASPYFNPDIDSSLGYHTESLLVVPLLTADGRILGGLELLNKPSGFFTAEDEQAASDAAARLVRWIERGDYYPAAIEAESIALRNNIGCDRSTVFMLDVPTSRLASLHADGGDGRLISLNMKLGIAGLCAVTGSSLNIAEAWEDPRFDRTVDQRTGFRTRSLLCVALKTASGQPIGVVEVINRREGVFSDSDLATLEAVAGIIAVAIENAMLLADQERQFSTMLDAMTRLMDVHDPLIAGHSCRVAECSVAIGSVLGFNAEELDLLRVAAMLADYGMIGVDDTVLKKNGPLTETEIELVRRHVEITTRIIERVHFTLKYRKAAVIAAAHHERLDGKGYPRGLHANEIPVMAKILAVADVFSALTAKRHHRESVSCDEALCILDAGIGSQFDAGAVAALKQHLANTATPAPLATPSTNLP